MLIILCIYVVKGKFKKYKYLLKNIINGVPAENISRHDMRHPNEWEIVAGCLGVEASKVSRRHVSGWNGVLITVGLNSIFWNTILSPTPASHGRSIRILNTYI